MSICPSFCQQFMNFNNFIFNCVSLQMIHMKSVSEELSGSVVEGLTRDEGLRVRASPEALRCVLEQDILSVWYWFNPGIPVPK